MRRAFLLLALFIVITACATKPDTSDPADNFVLTTMLPLAQECVSVHGSCCATVSLQYTEATTPASVAETERQCKKTFASHGLTISCQLHPTALGEMGTVMMGPMSDCA